MNSEFNESTWQQQQNQQQPSIDIQTLAQAQSHRCFSPWAILAGAAEETETPGLQILNQPVQTATSESSFGTSFRFNSPDSLNVVNYDSLLYEPSFSNIEQSRGDLLKLKNEDHHLIYGSPIEYEENLNSLIVRKIFEFYNVSQCCKMNFLLSLEPN